MKHWRQPKGSLGYCLLPTSISTRKVDNLLWFDHQNKRDKTWKVGLGSQGSLETRKLDSGTWNKWDILSTKCGADEFRSVWTARLGHLKTMIGIWRTSFEFVPSEIERDVQVDFKVPIPRSSKTKINLYRSPRLRMWPCFLLLGYRKTCSRPKTM